MPVNREDGISASQTTLLERAAAVTRAQINAAMWALDSSDLPNRTKADPVLIAAAVQAIATSYLAEALKMKPIK